MSVRVYAITYCHIHLLELRIVHVAQASDYDVKVRPHVLRGGRERIRVRERLALGRN